MRVIVSQQSAKGSTAMEESQTALHPLKAKMQAGQAVLGLSLRMIRSPDAARLARTTGHDFLFIDVQHAIFNLESISAIAQTALAIGIAPLVRVRSIDDPDVPVLLDNGVTGIVFPDVNTPDQAKRAVDRCRFPPIGRRSLCAFRLSRDAGREGDCRAGSAYTRCLHGGDGRGACQS
jgi:2-keto-3-deoxy-L-rhamnonate aldolase RhmA